MSDQQNPDGVNNDDEDDINDLSIRREDENPPFNLELTAEQIQKANSGDRRAMRQVIKAVMAAVKYCAWRYRRPDITCDRADLEQVGLWGFVRAMKKYNPKRKTSISAFAWRCIRNSIISYIRKQNSAGWRIQQTINKMEDAASELRTKLQRTPTIDEIASECGLSPKEVLQLLLDEECSRVASSNNTSADVQIGQQVEIGEFSDPSMIAEDNERKKYIDSVLVALSPAERTAVMAKHGMLDGMEHSFNEIGTISNVTRQRAQQHYKRGMAKLIKWAENHPDTPSNWIW